MIWQLVWADAGSRSAADANSLRASSRSEKMKAYETDGHPFKLMTEKDEKEQVRLIRAIQEGKIKFDVVK